jgi:hypothetical protein
MTVTRRAATIGVFGLLGAAMGGAAHADVGEWLGELGAGIEDF